MRVAASTPGMKAERGAKLPSSTAAPPTDYAARDDKSALSESAARQQVRACTSAFSLRAVANTGQRWLPLEELLITYELVCPWLRARVCSCVRVSDANTLINCT